MDSRIFDRQSLKPSQLEAVAERRFGDAQALLDTRHNERTNGAVYLGGFVVEILLKARLIEQYPSLSKKGRDEVTNDNHVRRWNLIYRSHDLEEILIELTYIQSSVKKAGIRAQQPYHQWLVSVCATWTIFARYSTRQIPFADAVEFLGRVRILKELLK